MIDKDRLSYIIHGCRFCRTCSSAMTDESQYCPAGCKASYFERLWFTLAGMAFGRCCRLTIPIDWRHPMMDEYDARWPGRKLRSFEALLLDKVGPFDWSDNFNPELNYDNL